MLVMDDGKLLFAIENQGVWRCGTEPDGDDPPVWYRLDDGPWIRFCDSLAQFLVTLCLQETVFNSQHRGLMPQVTDYLRSRNCHVAPLWLDGPFVPSEGSEPRRCSFHLVDRQFLVYYDDWCGTNAVEPWKKLPELFKPEPKKCAPMPHDETIMDARWIPNVIKKSILLRWQREHNEQAEFHSRRAELFHRLALSLDGKLWSNDGNWNSET